MIWDNRFGAEDEPKIEGVTPATPLDRTTFSGGKGYYSGMLIRQK